VGRLPLCQLALDLPFVSQAHALVRWNGTSWEIRDLGSKNGTYLNQQRLAVGVTSPLVLGAEIRFGDLAETWLLVDERPPLPAAVPMDGTSASVMVSGAIAVPSSEQPVAVIYAEGDGWVLEIDDVRQPLTPGQRFWAADREWRFDCPMGAAPTNGTDAMRMKLDDLMLVFAVSRNEEQVALKLRKAHIERDLGTRSAFYLSLVLCEHRLRERTCGIGQPGWLDVDELLRMVPDYTCLSHVSVDIWRLRRAFHDAGVEDFARIIERRRGQVRLGTDHAEILRGAAA
jgi:hypothetical protein